MLETLKSGKLGSESYRFSSADQRIAIHKDWGNTPVHTFWFCKRDVFSEASCQEFERVCTNIANCVEKAAVNLGTDEPHTKDPFVMDEFCYSPLPFNPDVPLPVFGQAHNTHRNSKVERSYGGRQVTHIVPLEENSYEPMYLQLSGQDVVRNSDKAEYQLQFFFDRFLEDCQYAFNFHHGIFRENYGADRVDFLVCTFPLGFSKHPVNPTIERGCGYVKDLCEEMKKCYVTVRDFFTFSDHFEKNMRNIAVVTLTLTALPLSMILVECLNLMKVKRFPSEKCAEFVLILLLVLGSAALLSFDYAAKQIYTTHRLFIHEKFRLSGFRWSWEIILYFLVLFFHLYLICFAARTYFTMLLVTNVCK